MDKLSFFNNLNIVYEKIKNKELPFNKEAFLYVKRFISNNPNDEDVISNKKYLINFFQSPFLTDGLMDSFNLPDKFKYFKIQEIYKNLPIEFIKEYGIYFYEIFDTPSENYGKLIKSSINLAKDEGMCSFNEEQIKNLFDYYDNNNILFKSSKDTYRDYLTELSRYYNKSISITDPDYKEFYDNEEYKYKINGQIIDEYKIRTNYINKKLGISGEIFAFEVIKGFQNAIFTAKDLGNGFGYDMYYQSTTDNQIYENLIEVKTTNRLNGSDCFSLSKNEYNTMINASNEENTNYYIYRLFLNANGYFDIYLLYFQEEECSFKSAFYENDQMEYSFNIIENDNYVFSRKEKSNLLQL